jgi:hypothetical protein
MAMFRVENQLYLLIELPYYQKGMSCPNKASADIAGQAGYPKMNHGMRPQSRTERVNGR